MMVKAATLFILAMVGLALIANRLRRMKRQNRLANGRCPACGRPKIGPGPCPCGKA